MGVNRELKLLLKSWALVSEEKLASSEMEVELDMVADGNMEAFVLFSFTYMMKTKRVQIVVSGFFYVLISRPKAPWEETRRQRHTHTHTQYKRREEERIKI